MSKSKRKDFATSLVVGVLLAIAVLLGLQACPVYGGEGEVFADDFETGDTRWWSTAHQAPQWVYVSWVLIESCGETMPGHLGPKGRVIDGGRCSPSLWQVQIQRGPGAPFEMVKLLALSKPQIGFLCVFDPLLMQGKLPAMIESVSCEGGES